LGILVASLGAILLLSIHKTDMLQIQPILTEDVAKDTTSKTKCVAVAVIGFLIYFIPVILIALDQQYVTPG
jgi:hypothetical protein